MNALLSSTKTASQSAAYGVRMNLASINCYKLLMVKKFTI